MEFTKTAPGHHGPARDLRGTGDRTNAVPYYVALGRGADYLLRCRDCQRLVPTAQVITRGFCRCGSKRYLEVRTLTWWEWLKIRLGLLDFPYRAEFLKEFARG